MNRDLLAFLAVSAIWGTTWLVIKIGLADVPPFTFAAVRFILAAAVLNVLVAARRTKGRQSRTEWTVMLSTGAVGVAVSYALVYWGEQYIGSGIACVIQSTMPLFGLLLAHLLLRDDRLSVRKILGVAMGMGGIALIYSGQLSLEGTMSSWGTLALLGSATIAALSSVVIKRWAHDIDPLVLTARQMTAAVVPLCLLAVLREGNPLLVPWTPTAIGSMLYLALVGTVTAFFLYYGLVQRIPVTRVQLLIFVSTIIAVLLGVVVLGERFSWQTGLGSLVAVLGVLLGLGVRLRVSRRPIPPQAR